MYQERISYIQSQTPYTIKANFPIIKENLILAKIIVLQTHFDRNCFCLSMKENDKFCLLWSYVGWNIFFGPLVPEPDQPYTALALTPICLKYTKEYLKDIVHDNVTSPSLLLFSAINNWRPRSGKSIWLCDLKITYKSSFYTGWPDRTPGTGPA